MMFCPEIKFADKSLIFKFKSQPSENCYIILRIVYNIHTFKILEKLKHSDQWLLFVSAFYYSGNHFETDVGFDSICCMSRYNN